MRNAADARLLASLAYEFDNQPNMAQIAAEPATEQE
jgi:hypothetical protein